jgi:hypothetical protein
MYYLSNEKKIKKKLCVGHPTTHPDNAELAVRGPTHTNQIGPIRCPKWVGPLEMPSGSSARAAAVEVERRELRTGRPNVQRKSLSRFIKS